MTFYVGGESFASRDDAVAAAIGIAKSNKAAAEAVQAEAAGRDLTEQEREAIKGTALVQADILTIWSDGSAEAVR